MGMSNSIRTKGMPADVIKVIAIASMFIDHVGAVFHASLPSDLYMILRMIGRMAFPLFAFLLIEGFFHTRDVKKYLLRLAIFAVISEIPFDFAFFHYVDGWMYWGHQNVFVTLTLGLGAVTLLELVRKKFTSMDFLPHLAQMLLQVLIVFLTGTVADMLGGDYGHMGIYLIFVFYYFRDNKIAASLGVLLWLMVYDIYSQTIMQTYGMVALIPILFYDGRKGNVPLPKWFFYGFYPAHILLLALVRSLFF